jgi:hypothetical protein
MDSHKHSLAFVDQSGVLEDLKFWAASRGVEAQDMCVLHRLARLDVPQFDLPILGPDQEMATGPFWAVVTADRHRASAHGGDFIQYSRHSPAGETDVCFRNRALPREGSHHLNTRMLRPATMILPMMSLQSTTREWQPSYSDGCSPVYGEQQGFSVGLKFISSRRTPSGSYILNSYLPSKPTLVGRPSCRPSSLLPASSTL